MLIVIATGVWTMVYVAFTIGDTLIDILRVLKEKK